MNEANNLSGKLSLHTHLFTLWEFGKWHMILSNIEQICFAIWICGTITQSTNHTIECSVIWFRVCLEIGEIMFWPHVALDFDLRTFSLKFRPCWWSHIDALTFIWPWARSRIWTPEPDKGRTLRSESKPKTCNQHQDCYWMLHFRQQLASELPYWIHLREHESVQFLQE